MSEVLASPWQKVLQYFSPSFTLQRQLGWVHFSGWDAMPVFLLSGEINETELCYQTNADARDRG